MTIRDFTIAGRGCTEIDCDWSVYISDPDGKCRDIFSTCDNTEFFRINEVYDAPVDILGWHIDYMCIDNGRLIFGVDVPYDIGDSFTWEYCDNGAIRMVDKDLNKDKGWKRDAVVGVEFEPYGIMYAIMQDTESGSLWTAHYRSDNDFPKINKESNDSVEEQMMKTYRHFYFKSCN